MKRTLFSFLLLAWICTSVNAKIILPEFIGDNMVLQQSTLVKIWGKAKANTPVIIKNSWSTKVVTVRSDKDGKWTAKIATPKASYTPQSMIISDGQAVKINNILIGEVWLCSGQSNMEIPLCGFTNCPIQNANELIANASQNKAIRCVTIQKKGMRTVQDTCKGKWMESNPKNAVHFSACAYHFAIALNKALDVPVGIFVCSYGGSRVEGWLPEEILKNYPDINLNFQQQDRYKSTTPVIMYNAMLHPIEGYTIKGALWYQGESNVGSYKTYAERLSTMVKLWRNEWGQGDFPFYIVEIAPFVYGGNSYAAALLREQQYKASVSIPNSGYVCTNDLVDEYEQKNIHPKNKEDIGKRLCYQALSKTYKMEGIECDSPTFKSLAISGNKAIITLNIVGGFNRDNGFTGFEVAGEDKEFHPATAQRIGNDKIEVTSNEVAAPVAVRYGFGNYLPGNLKDLRELPLIPFRTDNW